MTGFGLLGHLRNVVAASKVGARIFFDRVPVLPAAVEYVHAGISPGGTHANHKFLADWVSYDDDVTKEEQLILCDAQTSGGLLAAVAPDQAEAVISSLRARGVAEAVAIGRIESANPGPNCCQSLLRHIDAYRTAIRRCSFQIAVLDRQSRIVCWHLTLPGKS